MDPYGSLLAVILMGQCLLPRGVEPIHTITVQWLLRLGVDPTYTLVVQRLLRCGAEPISKLHESVAVVTTVRSLTP